MNRKRTSGQALVEHLVLWPALLLLSMAAIQLGFLFRGKSTLEAATFMAAREGSINNAFKTPMKKMLAQAMAPLDLKASPNVLSYGVKAGVAGVPGTTYALNFGMSKALGGADVEIISPSKAIFNQFAKNQYILCTDDNSCPRSGAVTEKRTQVKQIPNDNLSVRPSTTSTVGSASINIQDANLLKVRSHWCFPLEVPIVNVAIYQTMNLLSVPTAELNSCRTRTVAHNAAFGWPIYYIPISASSVVRMQSAVRCEDSGCSNLGAGGVVASAGSNGTGASTGGGNNPGGNNNTGGNAGNGNGNSNGSSTGSPGDGNGDNIGSGDTGANAPPGTACPS